jgi:hypothetical protein
MLVNSDLSICTHHEDRRNISIKWASHYYHYDLDDDRRWCRWFWLRYGWLLCGSSDGGGL